MKQLWSDGRIGKQRKNAALRNTSRMVMVGTLALAGCGGGSGDSGSPSGGTTTPPVAAALPTCAQLGTDASFGLAGADGVIASTLSAAIVPEAAATASNPATPAFCQIDFTYTSGLFGADDGYDQAQAQLIKIRLSLPLSAADGGSGALQGNWVGKQMVSASPGSSNSLTRWANYAEGTTHDTGPVYAIRLGYVGSSTDTGQTNTPFGVIQTGGLANTLSLGTIADWAYRGTHYGKVWAGTLSKAYYGTAPTRVYYNGCSGGGNEGMGQLQQFGDEYDGALIGAPAYYWQQFRLADSWPQIVLKKLVQQGGVLPTTAQLAAANTAATNTCDVQGSDTVADGIVADPRACTFSAAANVCGVAGAPDAPNCLSVAQAAAIDRIWDGPRNHFGKRIWFPYDRGVSFQASTTVSGSTSQVMQWNHKDTAFDGNNLFADAESLALAGNPAAGITYENEATLGSNTTADYTDNQSVALDKAQAHGVKIIPLHGTQDGAIRWRHDVDYYRRAATYFGKGQANIDGLRSWYRLFPMPGVGHCSGGTGPSPVDPFLALVKWVEQSTPPDSLPAQGGAVATRTRLLCPYPQTAVYKGNGSTDDAANYTCGGNLETQSVLCDSVRTKYKHENEDALDYDSIGVSASSCTG